MQKLDRLHYAGQLEGRAMSHEMHVANSVDGTGEPDFKIWDIRQFR